ncbi:MAG TPA: hypothetical protein VGI83_05310, partial [Gemmatimonadales bacterium]
MAAVPSTSGALDLADAREPEVPVASQQNRGDQIYHAALRTLALSLPLMLVGVTVVLVSRAWPSMMRFGWRFAFTSVWDPVAEVYGAAPMIFGTLASSAIALCIAVPLSLGVAVYLTEFAPARIQRPIAFTVELLAAVPSVVYGLWGIYVLI